MIQCSATLTQRSTVEKEMGSERSSHNRFPSKEMEGAVMILVEAQKNHCDCDENASGIGRRKARSEKITVKENPVV